LIRNYKYDEIAYAEKIYKDNKFQTKHIPTELKLLVLYYRDYLHLKAKDRKEKLTRFCIDNIPNYNRATHFKVVNRALQKGSSKKEKLVKIESIPIYQKELDYINNLDIQYDYKKLLFAFLVQMRLNKTMFEIRNKDKKYKSTNYFKGGKQKYQNIKSMANVSSKININDEFINQLSQGDNPLISILHSGLISLNFLNECKQTGDIVIKIKDYENVGWYFDYYNHVDDIVLCEYCKQPFKQKRKDSRFCNKHIEYQPLISKTITCIDCGKEVEVDAKANNRIRCDECIRKNNNLLRRKNYYKIKSELELIEEFDGKSYLMQPHYRELIDKGYILKEIDTMPEKFGNYDCRAILINPKYENNIKHMSYVVFAKRIYW